MNLAYYVLVFDGGTDAWLDLAGIGASYRESTGCSVFAVETHTLYREEVRLGAPLQVRTRLVASDGKRLHLMHEMLSADTEVALQEVMFLHVDLGSRRSAPMAPAPAACVQALLPPPDWQRPHWLGRQVGADRSFPQALRQH